MLHLFCLLVYSPVWLYSPCLTLSFSLIFCFLLSAIKTCSPCTFPYSRLIPLLSGPRTSTWLCFLYLHLFIEIFKHDTVPRDIGFFISDICRPPTTDRRIFYIQSPQPNPDWAISYILSQPPSLPLCLLTTDSVQWAHTPLPPLQGSQTRQFPACTRQRTNPPVSSLHAILQQST